MTDSAAPSLRRDAQENLDRIMDAARELLAARGANVSIGEIAAAAGVGKATIYRSFPTKEDLLDAVALQRLGWFAKLVANAANTADPWAGFETLVFELSARLERDRSLGEALRGSHAKPELQAAKERIRQPLDELFERAIASGEMRPDASSADLGVMVSGYSQALTQEGAPAERWERCARLVIDGFRAQR